MLWLVGQRKGAKGAGRKGSNNRFLKLGQGQGQDARKGGTTGQLRENGILGNSLAVAYRRELGKDLYGRV